MGCMSTFSLPSANLLFMVMSSLYMQKSLATYKGYVNPLSHYNENTGQVAALNIEFAESADQLVPIVEDFLVHRDEYMSNVMIASGARVGTSHCADIVDTQNIWPTLKQIQDAGFELKGQYVNIGAGDGQRDDPLFQYVQELKATGVAVEQNASCCESHRKVFPQVKVECSEVTPQNILYLLGDAVESEDMLDILKIDIDSFDCPVLEVVLDKLSAKLILMEVNPSIPPPYQWSMLHHSKLWEFFNAYHDTREVPIRGCSLSYEVDMLKRHGYDLLMFGGHDAIFSHHSIRDTWLPHRPPVDEFSCFNKAFIVANGIPIELTRRWFYQMSDKQAVLPEIYEFFTNWMLTNASQLFPFALRG